MPSSPKPADTPAKAYISNPFGLIRPDLDVFKISIIPLLLSILVLVGITFGLFGVGLAVGVVLKLRFLIFFFGLAAIIALFAYLPTPVLITVAGAKGKKLPVAEAMKAAPSFALRFLGVAILSGLAILGGLLLFIVPGLIFIAWFAMAPYVLVNEDLSVRESLMRSRELARGRVWEVWGTMALPQLLSPLSYIAIFGQVANAVIGLLLFPLMAVRYMQLKDLKPKAKSDHPVHWANYVVVVLAIVAIAWGGVLAAHHAHSTITNPPIY